jgi:lipopolysaccharide-induced tumor necrosis factor-alpha factor
MNLEEAGRSEQDVIELASDKMYDDYTGVLESDLIFNALKLLNRMKGPDNAEPTIEENPTYYKTQQTLHRYQTVKSQIEEDEEQPMKERSIHELEMYKQELIESIRQLENHLSRLQDKKNIKRSDSSEHTITKPKQYIRRSTSEHYDKQKEEAHLATTKPSESSFHEVWHTRNSIELHSEKSQNVVKAGRIKEPNPSAYKIPQPDKIISEPTLQISNDSLKHIIPQSQRNSLQNISSRSSNLPQISLRGSMIGYNQSEMGKPVKYEPKHAGEVIIPRRFDRQSRDNIATRDRIVIPPQAFGHQPAVLTCPGCNKNVITEIKQVPSDTAWIACVGCALMGCAVGCCLIPFFIPSLSTWYHYCPNCKKQLGVKEAKDWSM